MKIYLASSFDLVNEVQRISDILEKEGHIITRKWWSNEGRVGEWWEIGCSKEEYFNNKKVIDTSKKDFKGVDECEALILVSPEDDTVRFCGANVEVGYAIAKDKFVLSIGRLILSPMYVPIIKFKSLGELLKCLRYIEAGGIIKSWRS